MFLVPTPDFFGFRDMAAPMPPKRPAGDAPESSGAEKRRMIVPQVVASSSSSGTQQASSSKVYYPSQDPQRLGAKGDVIE